MTAETAPGTAQPPTSDGADVDLLAGPCRLRVTGDDGPVVTAVASQLGAHRADAAGPADLTLAVGPLLPGSRRLLGTGEYAATEDDFVLLRGAGKRPVEVVVPFDELGQHPTLACTSDSAPVPLLVPILNLTALGRRVLPLHAAAFELDGLGVLVTGWSRSGKTETLLAFGPRGARYVGDEWVYLHLDGELTGLQEPMRVWSWHLRELGRAPDLPFARRASLALLDRAVAATDDRQLPGTMRRLRHLLSEQRNLRLPPDRLLPVAPRTQLDVVVLTESHDGDTITVEEISPALVAQRLAAMLPVERAPLLQAYAAYRYAFPGRRSDLLDSAEEIERDLLAQRLADVPALWVRHPYPFSFEAMAATLAPWLDRIRAGSRRDAPSPAGPEDQAASSASTTTRT